MTKDLFEHPDLLPINVKTILRRYSNLEIKRGLNYKDLEKMSKEMALYGYKFEYYLDCVPYNLKKTNIKQLN